MRVERDGDDGPGRRGAPGDREGDRAALTHVGDGPPAAACRRAAPDRQQRHHEDGDRDGAAPASAGALVGSWIDGGVSRGGLPPTQSAHPAAGDLRRR